MATLSNPAPNPAGSEQSIDIMSGGIQAASFRIFDIAGRLVLEEGVHLSKGQNTVVWTEFTDTLLPSGNYFISVTAEDGSTLTTRSALIR
ncbi:MAG: T9SS type A sorting domain-containing protein [Candidatus Fermentibacteria bacterium]